MAVRNLRKNPQQLKKRRHKIPALDQRRAIYNALGRGKGIVNSPSYLRLEAKLGATSAISFNLLVNAQNQTVTENRLNINDTFITTDMAVFVFKVATGAATTSAQLHSFANPTVFTGAGEAALVNTIFESGKFSMTKNGILTIPSLDCLRFKVVGVAQQGLDVGVTLSYFQDEKRSEHTGFISTFTPVITFQGNDNVVLNINLPASVNLAGTASDNYCVLYFRGYLRQNASFVGQKK